MIGISYESEFTGQRDFQAYPNTYQTHWYNVFFQKQGDILRVTVLMDINMSWQYEIKTFDYEKLLRFIEIAKSYKQINFAHITMTDRKVKVLQTSATGRKWMIGVKHLVLLSPITENEAKEIRLIKLKYDKTNL